MVAKPTNSLEDLDPETPTKKPLRGAAFDEQRIAV
jgi:hypothetical protein